ncbi:hypothetical protein ACA910_021906 [Epithemia clementina (nom. ined.)]
MVRKLWTTALKAILTLAAIASSSSFGGNNSTSSLRYGIALSEVISDDEDQRVVAAAFRNLAAVDTQVVERFKNAPPGFRKHPSYYSEIYLPRARERTPTEQQLLETKWGKWNLVDAQQTQNRPGNEFYDGFPNRDVPRAKFPANAWQTDTVFLSKYLPEAVGLANRALEAILSEYGRGKDDMPDVSFEKRSVVFQPSLDGGPLGGGGTMTKKSFEGLKRRVLHAVVTEDRFTVAMAGHSAAAGHGNHFQQTYTLQIQRILEPIFARLGAKMSGRNFGMGGLGTLHNTVASGDIYGRDVDVLLWDSGMTEPDSEPRGVMAVQALVGIDRAPFLWFERDVKSDILKNLHAIVGADVAVYGSPGEGLKKIVGTAAQLEKLPWAIRYMSCPSVLKAYCAELRYNGTCWRDRRNFQWEGMDISHTPATKQQAVPGGRAGWHPGNREHQLTARSFTFTILLALRDVLTKWKEADNYVLADSDWHVTDYYASIKAKVVESKDKWAWYCEKKFISTKFCLYAAKGRTENMPRNRPWATSLRAIMAGSEHPKINLGKNEYDPPDIYIPELDAPYGEIDVLGIVENGVPFRKNLARIFDSAQDMQGRDFSNPEGKGSKHDPKITGGKGWQFHSKQDSAGTDNCDGEHDSWCNRIGACLTYGHNDHRTGLFFDGFSGWMIFNLPKVEHGVIMIKMHTWAFYAPDMTKGWCSENNKEPCTSRALSSYSALETNYTTSSWSKQEHQPQRLLKPQVPKYCDGFKFEFAIDGKHTIWDVQEFQSRRKQAERVVEFFTLLDDDSWKTAKDVELAIRITGCGRQKPLDLTHIYWI